MNFIYNQKDVGKRIKKQRKLLGLKQKEAAAEFCLNPKYYSDIECGTCGMSINTLIQISLRLNLSLDYIIYGIEIEEKLKVSEDIFQIICILDSFTEQNREKAISSLKSISL